MPYIVKQCTRCGHEAERYHNVHRCPACGQHAMIAVCQYEHGSMVCLRNENRLLRQEVNSLRVQLGLHPKYREFSAVPAPTCYAGWHPGP